MDDPDITALLHEWTQDRRQEALTELVPQVYEHLRFLADRYLADERSNHTLQPTALVNEVYIRLTAGQRLHFKNRGDFFAFAGTIMRHILVDAARRRRTALHGGHLTKVPLDLVEHELEQVSLDPVKVLALDAALTNLAAFDPALARLVELKYFAGMKIEEIGEHLDMSRASVNRELRTARRWLASELETHRNPEVKTP